MSLKRIYYLLAIILIGSPLLFVSCNKDETASLIGDWDEVSDFDGIPRGEAVGFVIGNKGYLATGVNIDKDRMKDLWYYDAEGDYWMQKAVMTDAIARSEAVAFSVAGKGYVGTGIDDDGNELKDFWCYDPATNVWTRIDDFPGSARYGAVAFAVSGKGYVGTGADEYGETKDFYEYNPATGKWEQIIYNGSKRRDACAFVIGEKAYLLTGMGNNGNEDEVWAFDGTTKKWTELRKISDAKTDESFDDDYTTLVRTNAVAFAVNGKGYLATGTNNSAVSNVWEYNPSTDVWTEKTSFPGGVRTSAVAFGIGNYGYVTSGMNTLSYFYGDIAKFDPSATDDEVYY